MSSKIFGCGTDWDFSFIDFDTDITPVSKRIKINTSLDKRLSELFSSGFECVSSDGEWSLSFIGLKELDKFRGIEEIKEMINKLKVIPIILMNKILKIFKMFLSTSTTTQLTNIHQNLNSLLYFKWNNTNINRLLITWKLNTILLFLLHLLLLLVLLFVASLLL